MSIDWAMGWGIDNGTFKLESPFAFSVLSETKTVSYFTSSPYIRATHWSPLHTPKTESPPRSRIPPRSIVSNFWTTSGHPAASVLFFRGQNGPGVKVEGGYTHAVKNSPSVSPMSAFPTSRET